MGLMQTDRCFITDLEATNIPSEIDIYEYKINFQGKERIFRFDVKEWGEIINGETKGTLLSLLLNDEWPLDRETIISPQLIANIMRMGPQPKVFKEKTNHFLEFLYNKGANEFKWIEIDIAKFHVAYAKNEDEYSRILEALKGEKSIEFAREFVSIKNHAQKVRLTTDGIRRVEENPTLKTKLKNLVGEIRRKPSIFLLHIEKDKTIAAKFNDLFSKAGFTVHTNGEGVPDKSHAYTTNVRQTIYNEVNYFLIIKSRVSDMNNTFGSVIDIAIESHILTKSERKFIYIASIDDTPYDSRPRLVDYHQQSYDGRLHNIRERLLFDVLFDWRNRILHFEETKVPVTSKLDLLRWLIVQYQIFQQNPVKFDLEYFRKNQSGKEIDSDQKLVSCLEDLKVNQVITYEVYKSPMAEVHYDYHVTILNNAPDWLNLQQKTTTADQTINKEPKTASASEEKKIPLIENIHDEIFLNLKQWAENGRTSSPGEFNPFFYMRSVRDERFKKGYWFPGNESYLCLSFWAGGDSYNKTPNIYFEIHAKYGIRVIFVAKDSELKAEYLKSLSDHVNSQFNKTDYVENKAQTMWIKSYSKSFNDYSKCLQDFLENDKVLIDNFISDNPPPEFEEFVSVLTLIDSKSFDVMLARVLKEREMLSSTKQEAKTEAELVMSINSISVENYQGIAETQAEDLPLDAPWIFLTGENGFGKTSILQSLALGLDSNPELEKYLEEKTRIQLGIAFRFVKDFVVRTKGNLTKQNSVQYSDYIIGYGPSRLVIQAKTSQNAEDKSENSILSLFDYQTLLKNINYEFLTANRGEKKLSDTLEELVKQVTSGRITGVKIVNREVLFVEKLKNGDILKPQPLEKLAAGFKVVLNVAFDIFMRFQKVHKTLDYSEYFGIVFIDELENHLHPSFQKELPKALSSVFPKIQFVATTHSPIPLLGAPVNSVFLKVERSLQDGIICRRLDIDIKRLLPNSVFTSPLFDMENIANSNISDLEEVNTIDDFKEIEKQDFIKQNLKSFEAGDKKFPDDLFK